MPCSICHICCGQKKGTEWYDQLSASGQGLGNFFENTRDALGELETTVKTVQTTLDTVEATVGRFEDTAHSVGLEGNFKFMGPPVQSDDLDIGAGAAKGAQGQLGDLEEQASDIRKFPDEIDD